MTAPLALATTPTAAPLSLATVGDAAVQCPGDPVAIRASLNRRLGLALDRCFTACAQLDHRSALDDDDRARLKRRLKWKRSALLSVDGLEERVRTAAAFAKRLEKQLRALQHAESVAMEAVAAAIRLEPSVPLPSTPTSPVAAGISVVGRPARRTELQPTRPIKATMPVSLDSLPSVDLLDGVLTGAVSWEEALSEPPRRSDIAMATVIEDEVLNAEFIWRKALLDRRATHSARAAVEELRGTPPRAADVRFAQRLFKAANEGTPIAELLIDQRHRRVTTPRVMVPLVKALVLLWWNGRKKITAHQITTQVKGELAKLAARARADGYRKPFPEISEASVQKFLQSLPKSVKRVRDDGMQSYIRQARVVCAQQLAKAANQYWELDHSPADIWAVVSAEQPEQEVQLYLTACIDAYSGLPLAVHVDSRNPTAYTTSIVLRQALVPSEIDGRTVGGIPEHMVLDNGKDFTSTHVQAVADALGIQTIYAAPRTPDEKPHVERFFRTLNQHFAQFPGYKPADGKSEGAAQKNRGRLLTVRQIKEEAERFRMDYCRRASEKRAGSPLDRYADTVMMRPTPERDLLDLLLLKSDEIRTLTREGVQFRKHKYVGGVSTRRGHRYSELEGRRVVIRYHPDVTEWIVIFDAHTNEPLGELTRADIFALTGGASAINQAEKPRLLKATREYDAALKKRDHQQAREARLRELHDIAEERGGAPAAPALESTSDAHSTSDTSVPRKPASALRASLLDGLF